MKKLCMLIALALALSCAPALAAQGDAILGNAEEEYIYFNYCFSAGDTLYLSTYSDLFTYHVGDPDLKAYEFDVPELPSSGSFEVTSLPFCDGDKLYAINLIIEYSDNTDFYGATLAEMTLSEDGVAAFGESREVDWSQLVGNYDDGSYPIIPEGVTGLGGKVYIRYYDDLGDHRVGELDMSTGKFRQLDALEDAYTFVPYRGGTLLAELYNPETDENARFVIYDPADESVQALGEVPIADYSPLTGLAYDEASDTLYCAKAGEVCPVDLAAGEIGQGVTDMPLEAYGSNPACMLEGGYYAYCSSGVVVRNLDPQQKAQTRLKINDTFWNESVTSAYYRFANAHGDVSTVLSREYSESASLLENMMNRDGSIDLYVLSTASSEYDALFNRGYLMELDGSEKAAALLEGMYPSVRESLSANGHLVAVPVALSAWTLGVNEKALNALGYQAADVPDNWPDFLDFLAELTGPLSQNSAVHLFYSGYTVSEARYELLMSILEDYQRYVKYSGAEMSYNTDLLRGLVAKLEGLDLVALGCTADDELQYQDDVVYEEYSEDSILLQTSTGCSIGNFYSEYKPMLMRVTKDAPAYLEMDATVVIVNPYTKNPEAALAFIDEVIDCMPTATLYGVDPSLSEPVRGEMNAANLQEARSELEALRAEYESADPEDKQMLEEEIRYGEESLAYIDENLWEVSPWELEWYRANDDNLVIGSFNWLYSEEAGEAQELLDQYRDGQLGADELLSGIDSKIRMMLLEGN